MKLSFNGKQNGSVECAAPATLEVNGREVSLQAVSAVSASMLAVLEELAKPEANGGVYRVERRGDQVRLIQVGLAAHAKHLIGGPPKRVGRDFLSRMP